MIIVPLSFNGTSLQSTDFVTIYPEANSPLSPSVNPQYVKRAGAWPVMSGSDFGSTTIGIEVECLGNFMDTFETLVKVFNVEDETPRQLIIKDTGDSDTQYSVYAIPKSISGGNDGSYARVTLALDNPVWSSVTQQSQTFSTTSATDSTSVTVNGNADVYPIFEITPTTQASSDYKYNTYLQVLPTSTDPWPNRFLDVTGTTDGIGISTTDTTKFQADGDDLRLFRDGVEVDRQLSGAGTSDCHVLCVCDMPGAITLVLKTAIAATTDTPAEVELTLTTANRLGITAMPNSGRLIIDASLGSSDTEEFTYTAKTITATKLSFTINQRAVRGTVNIGHAAAQNVRWLPYDFSLLYGNASATAPVIDDARKPIQSITSRNNSFVYTNFSDDAGLRSGIFVPIPSRVSDVTLTNSGLYTSTNDEGDTDPSTTIGMKAKTYLKLGVAKTDSVFLGWMGYFPDLIASVVATGEQSQTGTAWPTLALQTSPAPASTSFTNLYTITAQSATDYSTFTTWSKASSDAVPGANKRYLRWVQSGSITGTVDSYAKGGLTTLTVGLTNPPHVLIRTENSNYNINCAIYNNTTGDAFQIQYPVTLGKTIYVDTNPDFPTVKYDGQLINGAIKLSAIRAAWLKMQPGVNSIGYESVPSDPIDVSIVIKWYDRMRFL